MGRSRTSSNGKAASCCAECSRSISSCAPFGNNVRRRCSRCRRGSPWRGRARSPSPPRHHLRGARRRAPRLPPPRSPQLVSRRPRAEPARRAPLPWPAPAGRDRVGPRVVRGGRRRHRPGHRPARRQTAGRAARPPGRRRRRRLLRRLDPAADSSQRRAGDLRRWQGHHHAPRRLASRHRQSRRRRDTTSSTTAVQRRSRYRKRFAEVGAVYDITPVPRSPADVLASHHGGPAPPAPTARGKWITASVVDDAADRRGTSLRRSRTT